MRSILFLVFGAWPAFVAVAGSPNEDHFPQPPSKKGLQVQMADDAIALGVHHAAINVDLVRLIDPNGQGNSLKRSINEKVFAFSPSYLAAIDSQIKPLSDQGIVVTLILLTYASKDARRDELMLHPRYSQAGKHAGPIAMFNTTTTEGTDALQACIEFLADRYSSEQGHGRVWGYICGNEVNSHWFWANMGHAKPDEVIMEYERAVRLIHQAVRKFSREARVYISLDHFWNERYAAGCDTQCLPGREFLELFTAKVKKNGDIDWHLAYHPYPEPLTDPKFWRDGINSPHNNQARCISFRNLDVLMNYLQQEETKFAGNARRVILSEQGFHCNEQNPRGELEQAAAYALAYKTIGKMAGIDAFILHRHVDHAREGGLNLGLWTNKPGQICSPDRKRKMYEIFQAAGTSDEERVFEFALPIIDAANWQEALQRNMDL